MLFVLLPVACANARPVIVVAANTILADLVREVGGDEVRVACLARAGTDLHDFEPQASDVRTLADADIGVLNGLGLETWIGKLVRNSGFHGAIVTASDGIDVIRDSAAPGGSHLHSVDPHAWHDPAAARIYVRNIRNALTAAAPGSAALFASREADFLARLDRLDAWAKTAFAALPPDRRRMVTSHDSLAYLGRAYDIEVISVTGISASAEASAKRVAAVEDAIHRTGVRAVFIDSADNPALMERIASDTGVRLGGQLLTDSLGSPGTGADTYLGMMRQNLRRILDSLE